MDKKLISSLVKSMEINKNDIVILQLWGENEYLKILDDFCVEIVTVGASPIKIQHSRIFYKTLFESKQEDDNVFSEQYFKIYEPATAVIDLLAYQAAVPHPEFPKSKLNLYRNYMRNLMMTLSSKEKFIQLRLPTEDMANEFELDFTTFKEMLENAYSVDYCNLKNNCHLAINHFKGKSHIEIRTGKESCLTFSIEDREWYLDNGNGDFPSGEVYIAPLENSANGDLFIEKAFFENNLYYDLLLSFNNGKLRSTNNDSFNGILKKLPINADILCEFGIGLNDRISQLTGFTVFDEKAINTCHIGLGMNSMFGGTNNCQYHADIVFKCDVFTDGSKIISNGKIV